MTDMPDDAAVFSWLTAFINRHDATSGTVHLLGADSKLGLVASHNIPAQVLTLIQAIPRGKGMAGLAWELDQPVSTCNLRTDTSGDVRPGAKAVAAQAAVALPVHQGDQVTGVVGIAFSDERVLSNDDLIELNAEAETVPQRANSF